LQRSHQFDGINRAKLERPNDTQYVFPVLSDEGGINPASGNAIEGPVVGCWIHTPEAHPAEISQARTELIAQQMEQTKDRVRVYVDTFATLVRERTNLFYKSFNGGIRPVSTK